jgi:hypothetical protein
MRYNIKIIKWINRIFLFLVLLSFLFDILFNKAIVSFYILLMLVGIFQLFASLILLFYINTLKNIYKTVLGVYFILIIIYFILLYSFDYILIGKYVVFKVYIYGSPVLIMLLWSYLIEKIDFQKSIQ